MLASAVKACPCRQPARTEARPPEFVRCHLVRECVKWLLIKTKRGPAHVDTDSDRRRAGRVAAIQYTDDLQRDRALRRAAAAPWLFAAHDPLPAAQPGPDRRLRGDFANAGLEARTDGINGRPAGRLSALRRLGAGPQDRRRLGPRRAGRVWVPSLARSPRRSTRSSVVSGISPAAARATSTRSRRSGLRSSA